MLLVAALYANALHNPFMIDDHDIIVNHPDVVQPQGLTRLWDHDYWAGRAEDQNLYRPITILTYHLGATRSELRPASFRAINIVLLGGVAVLGAMWTGRYVQPSIAWATALLFAAHPLHTESINHIVGRADLLAMFGILGFVLALERAINSGRWTALNTLGATVCAVLAFGSKESGWVLLPATAVQLWIKGPTLLPRRPCHWWMTTVCALIGPALLFLIARAAVVGLDTDYGPSTDDLTMNPLRSATFEQRLPAAISIAGHYAGQILWPDTSFNQTPTEIPSWNNPSTWLGLFVLAGTLIGLAITLRVRHWLSVPLAIMLAYYLVIGNLLIPIGTFAANRLAVLFVFAGSCVIAAGINWGSKRFIWVWPSATIAIALVLISMLLVVWRTNTDWSSTLHRMKADVQAQPENPIALFHLGIAFAEAAENQADAERDTSLRTRAIEFLQQTTFLRPNSWQVRKNLAAAATAAGVFDLARDQYQWMLDRHPEHFNALKNLGSLSIAEQKFQMADHYLRFAAQIDATDKQVMHNLAVLAVNQGELDLAIERYHALLQRYPEHESGRKQLNQVKKALKHK